MALKQPITPCLWFDNQAEEAARFYTATFENSRITQLSRYTEAGREIHGREPGSVMVVAFELEGQPFVALNGGPQFQFSSAVSFQVICATQEEVDYYWDRLCAGGEEAARQCGWLKDKFGVSWQVVPAVLPEMMGSADPERVRRVTQAMLGMKKLDIAELQRAYAG